MAKFNSFMDLSKAWGKKKPAKVAQKALHEVGVEVRGWIRDKHGSPTLKKESAFTKAMKGKSSPLVDTGNLRNAVSFRATSGAVIIFSQEPRLQKLHEYGARWKMTDKQRKFLMAMMSELGIGDKRGRTRSTHKGWIVIPPRPIWRFALDANKVKINSIVREALKTLKTM